MYEIMAIPITFMAYMQRKLNYSSKKVLARLSKIKVDIKSENPLAILGKSEMLFFNVVLAMISFSWGADILWLVIAG